MNWVVGTGSTALGDGVRSGQNYRPAYRADIDGLRAVAVLSVVFYHVFPNALTGGFVGVDIFFVISGFLISSILLRSLRQGVFNFSDFYVHRINRIFTALGLVLIFSYILGWFLFLPDEYQQLGKHIAASASFIQNYTLWQEAGYFDVATERKPLMHLWSLAVEEQFYLVFPLFVWVVWRARANIMLALVVLASASMWLNVSEITIEPVRTFFLPQTRIWELLAGAVLAELKLRRSCGHFSTSLPRVHDVASLLGAALIAGAVVGFSHAMAFPGVWALLPVLGAALLIWAGSDAWVNKYFLSLRPMVLIGMISYPLYLWHWPLLSFVRNAAGETPPWWMRVTAVTLAAVLACLTYAWVERPIRFGGRGRPWACGLVAVISIVALLGLYTYQRDGLKFRGYVKHRSAEYQMLTASASDRWYRGVDDWLYLGNAYEETVRKLVWRGEAPRGKVLREKSQWKPLLDAAGAIGVPVVLLVGPDKSRVYPEYLPPNLVPAEKRYVDYFIDELRGIPGLLVHDPLGDFVRHKEEGLLYYRTDTHWNSRGALLAWRGLAEKLDLPELSVIAVPAATKYAGDLIQISGLKNFPLHEDDTVKLRWSQSQQWIVKPPPIALTKTSFEQSFVDNMHSLTDKYVWVIGDSFTAGVRPFINASFRQSYYVNHWGKTLSNGLLAEMLKNSDKKPDLIIVVKVERSF